MSTANENYKRLNVIRERWEQERKIHRADVTWLLNQAARSLPPWAGVEPDPLIVEALRRNS